MIVGVLSAETLIVSLVAAAAGLLTGSLGWAWFAALVTCAVGSIAGALTVMVFAGRIFTRQVPVNSMADRPRLISRLLPRLPPRSHD